MSETKVREYILDFIEREYKIPEGQDKGEFNFIENSYVDSMAFVQFVALLEEEFDVEFEEDEILSKKFQTLNGLTSIILSKKA